MLIIRDSASVKLPALLKYTVKQTGFLYNNFVKHLSSNNYH
jgi:hypothetical protein